jgi:hypothetical protein
VKAPLGDPRYRFLPNAWKGGDEREWSPWKNDAS